MPLRLAQSKSINFSLILPLCNLEMKIQSDYIAQIQYEAKGDIASKVGSCR